MTFLAYVSIACALFTVHIWTANGQPVSEVNPLHIEKIAPTLSLLFEEKLLQISVRYEVTDFQYLKILRSVAIIVE